MKHLLTCPHRCVLVLLALFSVQLVTLSQNPTPPLNLDALDSLDLPEAVVIANRAPVARQSVGHTFDVLTRAQLDDLPVASVAEALQYVGGLDLRQRGPNGVQADLSIRGGTFDQVLVLVNGIKLADPQTGHHALNIPVPLQNVERIEVLKGPAARLYGQNAFAGAINIVTRPGAERATTLRAEAGSFGLVGFGVSLDAPIGPIRQTLSYQRDLARGYRHNTDYDVSNLFYQGEVISGKHVFGALAGLTERSFGANGFYASARATEQFEDIQTSLLALTHRVTQLNRKNATFSQRLSWRRNQDEYVFVRANPSIYRNLHISQVVGWDGYYSEDLGAGRLGVGAELQGVQLRSNNLGDHSRLVANALLEYELLLLDGSLSVTPGVSVNYLSDAGTRALPGLDLSYSVSDAVTVYANAGATFRVPTYTDLYYSDRFNEGNENLEAERAIGLELGTSYEKNGFEARTAVWQRSSDDLIDYVRDSPMDTVWQPRNFTNATFRGVELKLAARRRVSWMPLVKVNYAFIDAQIDGNDIVSRYALDNLRHQVSAVAVVQLSKRLSVTPTFRIGDRVGTDDPLIETEVTQDYQLLDVRVDYRRRSLSFFGEATNLLDEQYSQANGVPLPGRWMRAGVEVRL